MIRTALMMLGVSSFLALTGGCTPLGVITGAGAAAGVAAMQERGVDGVSRDLGISTRIFEKFNSFDHTLIAEISVEVYESRVLLTGQVETEARRADAVRLAWAVAGVQDVINEIHVTSDGGVLDTARDVYISTTLESKITFDEKILAINYAIETVGGTVYLIGIAQSDTELERVINHARSISYVRHIVSHVRVKAPTSNTTATTEG